MNLYGQTQLQQSSQRFQAEQNLIDREADNERTILNALAGGELVRADDPRLSRLPGEALPTIEFSGQQFVSGQDLSSRLAQAAFTAPVEAQGGREFFEGTVAGDLLGQPSQFGLEGPIGGALGGSVPASRIDDFTVGSKEDAIAALESVKGILQGHAGFADMVAEIDTRIATVQSDEQFSLTEQKALEDRFGPDRMESFINSVSDLRERDREAAAAAGNAALDERVKNEVIDYREDGTIIRRDLDPDEAYALGLERAGLGVSPEQREMIDNLTLRPRVTAMDRQTEMQQVTAMASTDTRMNAVLGNILINDMRKPNGDLDSSHPLFEKITSDMGEGSLSLDLVQDWLRSPLSKAIRDSYAISTTVASDTSTLNAYLRSGGLVPFNVQAAIETPGSLIHQDVPLVKFGQGFVSDGPPVDAEGSAALRGTASTIQSRDQGDAFNALAGALRGGDYTTVIGDISSQADYYERLANDANASSEERAWAEGQAADLRTIAGYTPAQIAELMTAMDSISSR
jgi:hypothetical protein